MKTQIAFTRLKPLNSLRKILCIIVLLFAIKSTHAQTSTDQNFAYGDQKIRVNLSLKPSTKEFRAGITSMDSAVTKLKVWVCNGEERRCTVTISNAGGIFWNTSFKDAYYNQVYDLSLLDDGEYKIQISDGRKNFERTLLINSTSYLVRNVNVH